MQVRKILIIDPDNNSLQYLASEASKAGYEVFTGSSGKDGMISAWRERPHVIIIDPNLPDISAQELLHKMRNDRRTARCRYIAFSSLTNPQEIQAAINLDFDHYLAKESDALAGLLNAIEGRPQEPQAPSDGQPARPETRISHGKLIAFLSAKGGTGTSSLCANLAANLASSDSNHRVAVVDMVLPIGSIAPIVGYDGPLNIIEAADMSAAEATLLYFKNHLPKINLWGFQLLAGSPSPNLSDQLDIARIPIIINTLLEGFDYIFVDLGRSLSKISLPIILSAHQVALILSPDKSTVALTKTVLEYLQTKGLRREKLYPLINRAIGLEGLSKSEIDELLNIKIIGTLPYMGENFTLANNLNVPITHKYPTSSASIELRAIAQEIERRTQILPERRQPIT